MPPGVGDPVSPDDVNTLMECGRAVVSSVVGQSSATLVVNFAKTWAQAPRVVVSLASAIALWAAVVHVEPTTTGFTIRIFQTAGTNAGSVASFPVHWVAVRQDA